MPLVGILLSCLSLFALSVKAQKCLLLLSLLILLYSELHTCKYIIIVWWKTCIFKTCFIFQEHQIETAMTSGYWWARSLQSNTREEQYNLFFLLTYHYNWHIFSKIPLKKLFVQWLNVIESERGLICVDSWWGRAKSSARNRHVWIDTWS